MRITQLIEIVKEDVNGEESKILNFISIMLQNHFKLIILSGIPFLLYVLFQLDRLN